MRLERTREEQDEGNLDIFRGREERDMMGMGMEMGKYGWPGLGGVAEEIEQEERDEERRRGLTRRDRGMSGYEAAVGLGEETSGGMEERWSDRTFVGEKCYSKRPYSIGGNKTAKRKACAGQICPFKV